MKTIERAVALHARNKGEDAGQSGELFSARPAPAARSRKHRQAPEIAAARMLCHQLKRKRIGADKKRIIHLICLNLVAILKRRSQQA